MTAPAPPAPLEFTFSGKTFKAGSLDWQAIAWFERESGWSISEALVEIAAAQVGARALKFSVAVYLLLAVLRGNHPELTPDDAFAMVQDPAVQAALGAQVADAMPESGPEPSPGDADGNAAGNAPAPESGGG